MEHLTLELVLWMLLTFFVGCTIGCLLRTALTRRAAGSDAGAGRVDLSAAADDAALAEVAALPDAPAVVVEEASELAALDMLRQPVEPVRPPEPPVVPPPAAPVRPAPVAAARSEPVPAGSRSRRPQGLAEPRDAQPDNFQRISGIGPKLEKTLQDLGFFHFDQIAAWTPEEVDWINEHLRFRGRVEREQWIEQARLLAEGQEERFAQVYGTRASRDEGKSGDGVRGRRGQG